MAGAAVAGRPAKLSLVRCGLAGLEKGQTDVTSGEAIMRIEQARGLAELLEAAYSAFEDVLAQVREHQDPASGYFIPMVMAAASAANGRDYLGMAPSLPASAPREAAGPRPMLLPDDQAARQIAAACQLLAGKLAAATSSALAPGDARACTGAARCAREITSLMDGRPA